MLDAPRSVSDSDLAASPHSATGSASENSTTEKGSVARRDLLKAGAAGLAALGLSQEAAAQACTRCGSAGAATFTLSINDLVTTMVDGTKLNALAFGMAGGIGPRVPGPVLRVREGSKVDITVCNNRPEPHGFEITEIIDSRIAKLDPGCTAKVSFTAPVAGTYIYHDGFENSPLHRILGLHGVLVVEPLNGSTGTSLTPYSFDKLAYGQKKAIGSLFDAFGTDPRFPGGKWVPAQNAEFSIQEKIWVFADIDPKFNGLLRPGSPLSTSSPLVKDVVGNFVPRYFTINGRSGFDAATGDDIVVRNFVGEPTLIRNVNVGLVTHSPHIHGNNVYVLTTGQLDPSADDFLKPRPASNIPAVDVWSMNPMLREDVLLPLERPTDIPAGQFDRMVAGQAQEPFPLRYVMHCHCEMSQTAAGGNYPQGLVTHWEMAGGVGGRAKAKGTLAAR